MKKIAIVTTEINNVFKGGSVSGGGGVVAENLIREIAKMPETKLTIFVQQGNKLKIEGIDIIEIPHWANEPKFLVEVDRIIRKSDFDIILSLNFDRMYKNPILQCHSFQHRCDSTSGIEQIIKWLVSTKKIAYQRNMFKEASKSSKFFAMSNIIKEDYVNTFNLNPDNVHVVYPACKQVFDEYPIMSDDDKITFGVVANSALNKGGHLFVFALGIMKMTGFDFNLKMISPKYDKDILMKFLVKVFRLEERTEIFPAQKNMLDFYSKISCLALPSKNEAFGLVVLEAMSLGIPCIVSSTAGVAEIIDEEKNGFIFRRNSFKNLLDTLEQVIHIFQNDFERYKKYSFNAYETSKDFTWQKFALNIVNKF